MHFFWKRRNTSWCTPWFFSLNNTSQKHVHMSMVGCICRWQDRRKRHCPSTMWTFMFHPVYFTIPVTAILCGRQNKIKEVQVLCRNTYDRCSARVLVEGMSYWFQIWGWGGVEYINKPTKNERQKTERFQKEPVMNGNGETPADRLEKGHQPFPLFSVKM